MPDAGLEPGSPVRGTPRLPPSKSVLQRALLCAAVARGRTVLGEAAPGTEEADDVAAARGVAQALGARVDRRAGAGAHDLLVVPGVAEPEAAFALGESATLARLATAVAALARPAGTETLLVPEGTLRARSSAPLFRALRAAGAGIAAADPEAGGAEPDGWPARVRSASLADAAGASGAPGALSLRDPVSSQELSALLLAAAAGGGGRAVAVTVAGALPSRPYVDLTVALLARFGVRVEEVAGASGARFPAGTPCARFDVRGPLVAPAGGLAVEPDASAAAVALAAACLSGGEVRVPGLGPGALQGDVRVAAHLAAFGCDARLDAEGLSARGAPRRGAALDLAGEPDLAPVLAAVAAGVALRAAPARLAPAADRPAAGVDAAEAVTTLAGLGALPRKESDRLAVLAAGLGAAGLSVRIGADVLSIAPGRPTAGPLRLDAAGDHRMAFAFALLGLARPGVTVVGAECVAKSWPGFWEELARLGARRVVG